MEALKTTAATLVLCIECRQTHKCAVVQRDEAHP